MPSDVAGFSELVREQTQLLTRGISNAFCAVTNELQLQRNENLKKSY